MQLAHDYLRPRGVALDDFENAGCAVTADANRANSTYPADAALVFNFYNPLTGAPFTYTDKRGQIMTFHRIKPLGRRKEGSAKFLQPRGSGTHIFYAQHSSLDWPEILGDTSYGLIVSEGETRSLAGAAHDVAVISLAGVDCGQLNGELHPDLSAADWQGRQVFLAFDSDVSRKDGPQRALKKLAALLCKRGAMVFQVHIPPSSNGKKQGTRRLSSKARQKIHLLNSSTHLRQRLSLDRTLKPSTRPAPNTRNLLLRIS